MANQAQSNQESIQPPTGTNDQRHKPDREATPESPSASLTDSLILLTLTTLTWVAWLVPWSVWRGVTLGVGWLGMSLQWRNVVLANVRHALHDQPVSSWAAWTIGARQIATHSRTIVSMLRAARRGGPNHDLMLENFEALTPYLGERGLIVVAPHSGPYPILGMLVSRHLKAHGFTGQMAVVARLFRPFRSGALMDWFVQCLGRAEVEIVPIDTPPQRLALRLNRVLARKGVVVLLVDEPTRAPSATVPFFDSEITMPIGPVRLAQATKSMIVPAAAAAVSGRRAKVTIGNPIEPTSDTEATLAAVARELEPLILANLDQWSMLTPIWPAVPETVPAHKRHQPLATIPAGYSLADLHLHTPGSDGLCTPDEWIAAARARDIRLISVTDHDHHDTIRRWRPNLEPGDERSVRLVPGVELTARGRAVHLGVLFPGPVPDRLPEAGTPLPDLIRWARGIRGAVVILVHPLPLLWRFQLAGLARDGLLPDAIETRFPFLGWRSAALERAAARYQLARIGGSDAHLSSSEIGRHATLFPGETLADLVTAIQDRATEAITLPPSAERVGWRVTVLQSFGAWLLPFRRIPAVGNLRWTLISAARAQTGLPALPENWRTPERSAPPPVASAIPLIDPLLADPITEPERELEHEPPVIRLQR